MFKYLVWVSVFTFAGCGGAVVDDNQPDNRDPYCIPPAADKWQQDGAVTYLQTDDGSQWQLTTSGEAWRVTIVEGTAHSVESFLCDVAPNGYVILDANRKE